MTFHKRQSSQNYKKIMDKTESTPFQCFLKQVAFKSIDKAVNHCYLGKSYKDFLDDLSLHVGAKSVFENIIMTLVLLSSLISILLTCLFFALLCCVLSKFRGIEVRLKSILHEKLRNTTRTATSSHNNTQHRQLRNSISQHSTPIRENRSIADEDEKEAVDEIMEERQ